MLRSSSTLTIPVRVAEHSIVAVVDSATDVTIISDRVFSQLRNPPPKLRDVKLDTAGRKMTMRGFVAGPIKLKIGETWYRGPVYVAPIEQDMLLGIDLLKQGSAVLNIGKGTLTYEGYEITMGMTDCEGQPMVARVTVTQRKVVPPHSVVRIKCAMDTKMPECVIEPSSGLKVTAPRVVSGEGNSPTMCLVNTSDRYLTMRKGTEVGRAYPVDAFVSETDTSVPMPKVLEVRSSNGTDSSATVPEHLDSMY